MRTSIGTAVGGPECEPLELRGPAAVSYEHGDTTHSIRMQFDGDGDLLRINGVRHDG